MTADVLFGLTVAFLATHELDAVKRHEWRILPLTSWLSDQSGERVFIWSHVPLFLLILWIAGQGAASTAALALSAFAVLHAGLHWLFRAHPQNEFTGAGAWLLILGAALSGGCHLLAAL